MPCKGVLGIHPQKKAKKKEGKRKTVVGLNRASFVNNPTDGAQINLRQLLKNKAFYEAKVALHFDL